MEYIDLRSDTVTHPTPSMRTAMANAVVGDDVYGEDPSINLLQEKAADLLGKEAALFVPSGTMANLVAILTHCGRGDEVIVGNLGHTYLFEGGGAAALGGVHPFTLPNQPDGTLSLTAIQSAIRSDDPHFPISRLVILENTHNRRGGVPITAEYTCQVKELIQPRGLKLHLDGARIFNAAVALNVPAAELAAPADSVMFCLSKALCAPVGSLVCGTHEFISRARRIRKQLGGGMRQAGILAAAGLVALEENISRLSEDHERARHLASGLREIQGLILDPGSPATNMVFLSLPDDSYLTAPQVATRLLERGIKIGVVGSRRFRLVMHYWITDPDVDKTVEAFRQVML
jgi:threonine aldolase